MDMVKVSKISSRHFHTNLIKLPTIRHAKMLKFFLVCIENGILSGLIKKEGLETLGVKKGKRGVLQTTIIKCWSSLSLSTCPPWQLTS